MPLRVDVVAAERSVLSEEADEVLARTLDGQIDILPHHAPLLTLLAPGELRLRRGAEEHVVAVSGGFLEVSRDRVTVLADSAERAEEVDVERAEEARRRALARLSTGSPEIDQERARAALARALARMRVAERTRRRTGSRPRSGPESYETPIGG